MNFFKKNNGFTVLEIVVSLSLFAMAVLLVGSMYDLSQKSYNKGANRSEVVQNARVVLDRMSREMRQTIEIITNLPNTEIDPLNPPSQEIFFQDGHDISRITYIKYYLDDNYLMRMHIAYYFPGEPNNYVLWNSVDQNSNPPLTIILEDRIVGEYFNSIKFWGENGLINTKISLTKNRDTVEMSTSVFARN